jgi:phosphoenolpyruvate---glycerone phosphotransferase subunit DhaL
VRLRVLERGLMAGPTGLDVAALRTGLARVADAMIAARDELNACDAALGDGDVGVAVAEGFSAVKAELPGLPDDLGAALMKCSQALVRVRASSYATLLATGFIAAATVVKGSTSAPWSAVPSMLEAAIAKMSARGRSALGDKTVLDSLAAVRAATSGVGNAGEAGVGNAGEAGVGNAGEAGVGNAGEMLARAATAAAAALDEFRPLPCLQGRARIFGDKSRGLDDPGMLAFTRMVQALAS